MTNKELLDLHVRTMMLLLDSNRWAYHAAKNAAHYARLLMETYNAD